MTYRSRPLAPALATVLVLLGATGCGQKETPFPSGIEPLEENQASWPVSESEDYPEEISMVWGEADEYVWVHARAYVHASLADTWRALQEPDVVVDRRRVAEWDTKYDVEPEWDFSMEIHHVVHDIVSVEYDLAFRHGVVSGTRDEPEVIGIRWQKTYGSSLIDILEGSMVVSAVDDEVTGLEIIEHLGAPTQGTEVVEAYLGDLHNEVVAFVDGRPLPDPE